MRLVIWKLRWRMDWRGQLECRKISWKTVQVILERGDDTFAPSPSLGWWRESGGTEKYLEDKSVVLGKYCIRFQLITSPTSSTAPQTLISNVLWMIREYYVKLCRGHKNEQNKVSDHFLVGTDNANQHKIIWKIKVLCRQLKKGDMIGFGYL